MDYGFLKFSIAAMISVFLGSHVVYSIYRPMDDFNEYVREAELRHKQLKLNQSTSKNA